MATEPVPGSRGGGRQAGSGRRALWRLRGDRSGGGAGFLDGGTATAGDFTVIFAGALLAWRGREWLPSGRRVVVPGRGWWRGMGRGGPGAAEVI